MAKKRRYYVAESTSCWSPIAAEIEAANRDKLALEQLAELLAAHRGGCNCARAKLAAGLRWLIYADPEAIDLAKLATQFDALNTAVGRLRPNPDKPKAKGPKLAAAEVEDYVAAEIERSHFDFRREESTNIPPPDSTRSDRKRRGVDDGGLKREWDADFIERDKDGATWLDHEKRANPRRDLMDVAAQELAEHVARTPDESNILDLLADGMSFREIAAELGISKYRVEMAVELFRRRAIEIL